MNNWLITGGAGFIGSNYAARLLRRGERVTVYDDLSREGAGANLEWLHRGGDGGEFNRGKLHTVEADVCDAESLAEQVRGADVVVHFAAQVAVTTSVADPRRDFAVNGGGTFNVLEAARLAGHRPVVLYASTNKVYGAMEDIALQRTDTRYQYVDRPFGIDETQPLDFHSPYGCSKGCGDQYVRDYHRIYGLPTVVFRQSCTYGPRQFGMADQGWLAWFMRAALSGDEICIYGDGRQVRDVLHVEDLLDAYDAAVNSIDTVAGEVFNIGGGPRRSIAVWSEFGPWLERVLQRQVPVQRAPWRPGDQALYISDIRRLRERLGWEPRIDLEQGLHDLYRWVRESVSRSG